MRKTLEETAKPGMSVSPARVGDLIAHACPPEDYSGKRVLLIVPDGTRTAPIGVVFRALHSQIARGAAAFDVLIALGTHQPMNEAAICQRLEISEKERSKTYRQVKFFNHEW